MLALCASLAMEELTGQVLDDRYEIVRKIGEGGVGTVYLARHVTLGNQVAVKILKHELATGTEASERFLREARITTQVAHPNVAAVRDFGQLDDGRLYMVLDFIDGGDAHELVRRKGPLPLGEFLSLAVGAARGLAAVHRASLVHRDIKPSNLLITQDGGVKLGDLGIARSLTADTSLTMTGSVMGTPQYMAPEQLEDATNVGPEADVFAFGATLYFLLTGEHAYTADSLPQIFDRLRHVPFPDVRDVRADVPRPLAALLMRCGEKVPELRPRDGDALVRELEALLEPATEAAPAGGFVGGVWRALLAPFTRRFKRSGTAEPGPAMPPEAPRTTPAAADPGTPGTTTMTGGAGAPRTEPTGQAPPPVLPTPAPAPPPPTSAPDADDELGRTMVHPGAAPIPAPARASEPPPSMILKPTLGDWLHGSDAILAKDLIEDSTSERLGNFVSGGQRGRYVLTGYGRFGGTSMMRGAIEQARAQLRQSGESDGALMALYFDVRERDSASPFEIQASEVALATLTSERFVPLEANLGRTFLGASPSPPKTIYNLTGFSSDLRDVDDRTGARKIREVLSNMLGRPGLLSRIIVVLDRIDDLATLEEILDFEILRNPEVSVLAIARKERFDAWDDRDVRLSKLGFREWYVPSLWTSGADYIQKISRALFRVHGADAADVQLNQHRLQKHFEFRGRGALGELLDELKHPEYWSFDHAGQRFLRLDQISKERTVQYNAWRQEVLDGSWGALLGGMFPEEADRDRARAGVYGLLDWIDEQKIFSTEELAQAAADLPVSPSDNAKVREEIARRLIGVLQWNEYLRATGPNWQMSWRGADHPEPIAVSEDDLAEPLETPERSTLAAKRTPSRSDDDAAATKPRSSFISYSTRDEAFAARLHADLVKDGFDCWKWDHDARDGETMWAEIDGAIRRRDYVILVASRSSLESPAVIREIRRALNQEFERSVSVLMPVDIDGYVFDGWDHELQVDIAEKKILNARGWKDDDAVYHRALERIAKRLGSV